MSFRKITSLRVLPCCQTVPAVRSALAAGRAGYETRAILGFTELVDSLPKLRKERVLLWHSAVIFTITTIRTEAIWKGRKYGIRTNFKWGDPESRNWFPISKVKYEIRLLLWETFRQAAENLQRPSIVQ